MKLLYIICLIFVANVVNAQSLGERLNKLQHAVNITIIDRDTTELRNYFTDAQSFQQVKNYLFAIKDQKKKLDMTVEQLGVYKRAGKGIDTLTIVYMGGDDDKHQPAMLGQMILTSQPDSKDWLFTSVKETIPASKVKDPLRYLQIYINMQGSPPPTMKKLE